MDFWDKFLLAAGIAGYAKFEQLEREKRREEEYRREETRKLVEVSRRIDAIVAAYGDDYEGRDRAFKRELPPMMAEIDPSALSPNIREYGYNQIMRGLNSDD